MNPHYTPRIKAQFALIEEPQYIFLDIILITRDRSHLRAHCGGLGLSRLLSIITMGVGTT